MDVFLSEGMEFIFKVALALLLLGKETLLCLDMEAMLKVSYKFHKFEMPSLSLGIVITVFKQLKYAKENIIYNSGQGPLSVFLANR